MPYHTCVSSHTIDYILRIQLSSLYKRCTIYSVWESQDSERFKHKQNVCGLEESLEELSWLSGVFCARQYFTTCFHDLLYLISISIIKERQRHADCFSGLQLHHHSVMVALGLIWQSHELEQRKDLSYTAAQRLMPQQGRERHWATWLGILEGKEWSCPFWYKLLFHGIRLSLKPHPHDREPSLSLWWDHSCTMQCLLTWITIIYTVKSYVFNQLKGGGLGLPEGNDEVREW